MVVIWVLVGCKILHQFNGHMGQGQIRVPKAAGLTSTSSCFIVLYLQFVHSFAAYRWLYEELAFSPALQYLAWIMFPLVFICFSTGFVHIVGPNAIGMTKNINDTLLFYTRKKYT